MELVRTTFDDRVSGIESYFELVDKIEIAVRSGGAFIKAGDDDYRITPEQQKIMYSGIYLHLYNLVESTVSMCIEAVERHALDGIGNNLCDFTEKMRAIYVKSILKPHESLSYEKRLEGALDLFRQVMGESDIQLKIFAGGGGSWGSTEIKNFSKTIGVDIHLPRAINQSVNRPFRDEKGPIRLIKDIRNKLAHGSLSFVECGEGHVASDFRRLINIVKDYLACIISAYEYFIDHCKYKTA
ncbi:MAG: MAE_28990/MAE_18760 family HEPN-like nuclease [Zhongshania sp.]|uniref:MAE_28990/MAE_18760 family HEPN-like nuclease n=1 Tax=Zhongshania sp. TaxID=1971902 RepID=UPI00260FB519|nr:MAE_28990/MAE_18760 family HEPN-like nuclease [Zhongshania sp.]MDF1693048.1 MAE_28990/MAE_18760 family HEPN-like nuclease [Zhongshania sp.]